MQCKYQIETAQAGDADLEKALTRVREGGDSKDRRVAENSSKRIWESQGKETILVVEDEEAVRNLTVRMLQTLGYRTMQAEHGIEALEICRTFAEPIHLILSDMVMPHMGGRQLVVELQKMRRNYKVLFVSGYGSEDTVDGKIIGADTPLIQKPFTRETLGRKIREMLNSQ
jgi:two-component system, cell cycle sensor histidine kinase and response regulator CckA